jgi:hypothetical protein
MASPRGLPKSMGTVKDFQPQALMAFKLIIRIICLGYPLSVATTLWDRER